MRMLMAIVAAAALVALASRDNVGAADKDAPKYSIEDVMEKAHDSGLLKKIIDGKGTKKEKEDLLAMYVALSKAKPPQGPEKSWKEKTGVMVAAAKDAVADKKDAAAKLKTAVDCKGCHAVHKP